MKAHLTFIIKFLLISLLLISCGGPSVTKIGTSNYKITVSSAFGKSGAMDLFHKKANEVCKGRQYDVLQSDSEAYPGFTKLYGVISCK